ncbi:MAG: response regulator transcription factor [Kiritimatiellae bacterium]|nr:response regulator transcription factor [Kiritimatiellia bacterium]MBQ6245648.1 response regulator transcription factor [Kiritimatiellia bacterium]
MSPRRVLLGGFSAAFASALRRALPSDEGWEIRGVPDATAVAAALASGCPPAFVLLDAAALGPANLPALCRSVRRAVPSPAAVRLEVLLPDLSPASVRAAYAAGVDECRVGPVSPATLALFVLAKTPPPVDSASDAFRFDPATGVARLGGRPLDLTSTEVRLLQAFVSHPGVALSRGQLLRAYLGDESGSVQPRAVDSAVAALRCKLGPAGWRVETAWGRGYRWNAASRPPLGARLVRRRARVVGSGVLGLLFAVLAVRALRPGPPAGPSASTSSVPEPFDPVAGALLDAFETAGPPAVDVARPKDAAEDDLSVFFPD